MVKHASHHVVGLGCHGAMRPCSLVQNLKYTTACHKLPSEWENDLLEYSVSHPEVRVIDNMECIRTLRNRGTMLTVLKGEDIVLKVGNRNIIALNKKTWIFLSSFL